MSLASQGIVGVGVSGIGPNLGGGSGYLETDRRPLEPDRRVTGAVTLGSFLTGSRGVGSGDNYRPAPSLPPAKHLDYLSKSVQAVAVLVLAYYLVRHPSRGIAALERRAGVK